MKKRKINAHKMLHRNITEFSSVEKYGKFIIIINMVVQFNVDIIVAPDGGSYLVSVNVLLCCALCVMLCHYFNSEI